MEALWLKNYPANAKKEINPDVYNNINEVIEESCQKYADQIAYVNMGVSMTYAQVKEKSDAFARYLIEELELKKGDVIAIQMPNLLQYPVVLYGAFKAGLIVVNTNPLYTERETKKVMQDSGAVAIVICENFLSKLENIVGETKIEHIITTEIGDFFPLIKRKVTNFVVKKVKKMVPKTKGTYMSLNKAISIGQNFYRDFPELVSSDIALFQYTGGTTGKTKAAMLSHRNLIANMQQMSEWIKAGLGDSRPMSLAPLPIYHVFTLSVNVLGFFKMGMPNLLITNPRDLSALIADIKTYRPELAVVVNTLLQALLNNEEFQKLDLSYMKFSVAGGMALKKSVKEQWEAKTKSRVIEGYGLTEASPVVSCNPTIGEDVPGSIGIPIPSTNVKITDADGGELAVGEEGELCVQGPQVMQGYWNQPEETAQVLTEDGWLKTGDFASIDEEGFIRILDRKKDMILVSGFNVYPNEVEDILLEMAEVADVAAIGQEDERSGQIVKVFIVKQSLSLTKESILRYAKENLAAYKVPKVIEFIDELPKNNVGKVLRRELR